MGSIFRTADAAAVSKIILSGYTPTPLDRFNQPRKDFSKVSLGAEHCVPWEHAPNITQTLTTLQKAGCIIAALEQHERSVSLFTYTSPPGKDVVIILGREVEGVEQDILSLCDTILEIPMYGKKESLNVSVAAGIAMYALKV